MQFSIDPFIRLTRHPALASLKSLGQRLGQGAILVTLVIFCSSCARTIAALDGNPWQQVILPTEQTVLDLAFTGDPNRGWMVGANSTLLETTDGGDSWSQRDLPLDSDRYRLSSISFDDQEGWIVGQPSLLLHTDDGGSTWSEIYLSAQLPGSPLMITALADNSAELVTDLGAIYRTTDGGSNWKGLVQYGSDTIINLARSDDGRYLAVAERGSFFSAYTPGDDTWVPHNRNSSRRLQNMGFGSDGRFWILGRGGGVQFSEASNSEASNSEASDYDNWAEYISAEKRNNWGLLDLGYRTPNELWATGGGGTLIVSLDDGDTWLKDEAVDNIPSNFYRVLFLNPTKGFVLGQRGIILKYIGTAEDSVA
ncbi:photosynthesis system II assembly factor Ycf48 [Prochlorothrix hollandica]|uniref:photosynthesis system II assembly factor Ycf48 n=1 Tax=Prochlorothrix hollandica TaxID=1223 RepID=UPI0003453141|nr:photosynthesis system II assembly factor Ycf48 [Prochlorothrix hollandica]